MMAMIALLILIENNLPFLVWVGMMMEMMEMMAWMAKMIHMA